jgi:uncharacterized membrane protein
VTSPRHRHGSGNAEPLAPTGGHLDPAPRNVGPGADHVGPGHLGHGHLGHGHLGHGGGPPPTPAAAAIRRRAGGWLTAIVVVFGLATAVGVAVLWPDGGGPQDRKLDTQYYAPGRTILDATITSMKTVACPGDDETPDLPAAANRTCAHVQVRLDTGPRTGSRVKVDLPPEAGRTGVSTGDRMRVLHVKVGEQKQTDYYAFVDFIRGFPMALLAVAYALVVVAVARLRGLRALLGLGFAYVMLAAFMLPALLEGKSPLLVGVVGSAAIMYIVLYFAHGFSARTTTALVGTLFGLGLTAVLAEWATGAARLTGLGGEESFILLSATSTVDLSDLVTCGIIIAGLGVLNDVTITQASAVWELYELSPTMSARRLFTGAMRIGRDHIASTVYTIAFAYAGAALPVLMLISPYQRPFLTSVTGGELAEEVVRTLVGSISLVLAIPITTAIGVTVVKAAGSRIRTSQPAGRPVPQSFP